MADDNQNGGTQSSEGSTASEGAIQSPADKENPERKTPGIAGQSGSAEQTGPVAQTTINKLVGGAKAAAYEKGQRDLLARLKEEGKLAEEGQTQEANEKITLTKADLHKILDERVEQKAREQYEFQIAQQFIGKIEQGKQAHPDFEATVQKLNVPEWPAYVIEMVNGLDNTAEVLYELGKNPNKFARFASLEGKSPQMAQEDLINLSNSIKQNQAAQQNHSNVTEPLDQLEHSTNGKDNSSSPSVADFQAKYLQ